MSLESLKAELLVGVTEQVKQAAVYDADVVLAELGAIVDILLRNGRGEAVDSEQTGHLVSILHAVGGSLLGMETRKRPEEEQKIQNQKLFDIFIESFTRRVAAQSLADINVSSPYSPN